ncbi:C4-dicarboxylate transporter/malic acid transport protein [Promicromonospora umidemergens]|uniref:TDT family transporter n=1 Tax=Promicromonospora umidemergens TaxID=629679 RepID=A0ABP8WE76_9MICO|nr:TDT family transporter [Promicromonospora umidemergens]MCP2285924.1 C4-dicarboxylate transporter/malic acid transport protein [Promicromonospora umidemergens]
MARFSIAHVTPNWFASVMGTGIVATSAVTLPVQFPGLRQGALGVWLLASAMLVFFLVATLLHWVRHPVAARAHHSDPVMAHFYGAPPMALLTVGAGTLLVGRDVVGLEAAVVIDTVLWSAGTIGGLVSAVAVPYLAFTRHQNPADAAFSGWLMPVVPPMVSAATGALLLPYLPPGEARETMLLACYAMFGLSLIASLVIIPQLWSRLMHHQVGASRMVPTLWITLGPLGQSVTAANLLAANAAGTFGASFERGLMYFAIVFGVSVLGFALMWAAIATAITVRAAVRGLPFSLTWWSFTFPVGTCVTATAGLAVHTGLTALVVLSVLLFVGLVAAWVTVAVRTAWDSLGGRRAVLTAVPEPAEALGAARAMTTVG